MLSPKNHLVFICAVRYNNQVITEYRGEIVDKRYAEIEQLVARGKYRKAISEADKMLGSIGRDENGVFLRYSFMTPEAFKFYEVAHPDEQITWVKNIAPLMYVKAYSLYELKRFEECVSVLKNAIEWDPVSVKLKTELCSAYIKLRDYQSAQNALESAADTVLNLHDGAVYYSKLGFLAAQHGEFERASDYLLYSVLFEETNAALRELEYVSSKIGEIECDEDTIQAAAKRLRKNGDAFSLNPCAQKALEHLLNLYTLAGDEEKKLHYDNLLQRFKEIEEV